LTSVQIKSNLWKTIKAHNGRYLDDPPLYGYIPYINQWVYDGLMMDQVNLQHCTDVLLCETKYQYEHPLLCGYYESAWARKFKIFPESRVIRPFSVEEFINTVENYTDDEDEDRDLDD